MTGKLHHIKTALLRCTCLCTLFIIQLTSRGQQGNNWYFGAFAGANFSDGYPYPLSNGQLNTIEGTSSITDENGNLLFYTDGVTVYNREHKVMPNGKNLKGHISSYQSCVIIPKPGSKLFYYIFTCDAIQNNGAGGYNYSEVNMALDGGLGDVTVRKNISLSGPSSERLCVAKAANMIDYWVITNDWGSNIFRAFKIDCDGINPAVVSTTGRVVNENINANIGSIKASADGKWLCQTNGKNLIVASPVDEYAQLFSFNNTTGVISNPVTIPLVNEGTYGNSEFSPDSKFMYIVNNRDNNIHQFDLSSGVPATIMASKTVIPVGSGGLCGIQMGPDKKIYLSTNIEKLHVISLPNNKGIASALIENAVDLAGRRSAIALPNFPPNYFNNRTVDYSFVIEDSCNGVVQFTSDIKLAGVVPNWDFGDGTRSNEANPKHVFADPRKSYWVKLVIEEESLCVYEFSGKYLNPGGISLVAGFSATVDCASKTATFKEATKTSLTGLDYTWKFGDGNGSTDKDPVHTYVENKSYTVDLIVQKPGSTCLIDTFQLSLNLEKPVVNAGADLTIPAGRTMELSASGALSYQWTPATYLNNASISNPVVRPLDDITYVVKGINANGCEDEDSIKITVLKGVIIEVPSGFTPDGNGKNDELKPLLYGVSKIEYFVVYDRWGNKVFETKTLNAGWDGKRNSVLQPTGTYIWMLKVEDIFGKTVEKKGTSLLIR